MAKRYLELNTQGKIAEVEATVSSAGAGDAGELVALDNTGRIDVSVLPIGVGPDVATILASENLSAGDYVNVYNNGGVANVRLADKTNAREAHGFVKGAVTSGSNAVVYFEGPNDGLSGLTIGADYFLDTAGNATTTVATAPDIHQFLGIAVSSTTINTDIDDFIQRA